jgi:hypothetical protein
MSVRLCPISARADGYRFVAPSVRIDVNCEELGDNRNVEIAAVIFG